MAPFVASPLVNPCAGFLIPPMPLSQTRLRSEGWSQPGGAVCSTKEQEAVVLRDVLSNDPNLTDLEKKEEAYLSKTKEDNLAIGQFNRSKGGLSGMSGGGGRTYEERSGNRFFKKAKKARGVDIFAL